MPTSSSMLNSPDNDHLDRANKITQKIRSRLRADASPPAQRVAYEWYEYEADINHLLDTYLPQCVLEGVKLFTPSFLANDRDFGLEVDNLFHISHNNIDHLILVEAKKQKVTVVGDEWQLQYQDGPSNAKNQMDRHICALMEYLEPISKDVSLKIIYYVATSVPPAATVRATSKHFNAEVYLIGYDQLIRELNHRFGMDPKKAGGGGQPIRISQSPFLDLLRLGFANAHLGHPEISAAVRYIERCRRELDHGLFKLFKPEPERWLINGSAGMGKSVLLAYAAAVLSSGYHLRKSVGGVGAYKANETLERIGFDLSKGALAMAANSQKQLDSLRYWFEYFVREFQKADHVGDVHFRRPEFLLFRDMRTLLTSKRAWAAVFIDEAHDLPEHAAIALKQASDELGFYLIAACDRHQRLRLAGSDAKVIPGFNFERKSKRLRQVYRNPAPVYIASLALMFRWFAPSGPKVVPTTKQLEDCFGFLVEELADQSSFLTIKNDSHPANCWRHTIARFDDASTAATLLRREKLNRTEVLWVRFSAEDPSFDYEKLQQHFTYHNCRTEEAVDLNDKYIKGQDYPVVVIEGFPRFMDQYADKATEDDMWAFRRELYLCASRATCFLFFICSVTASEEIDRINLELNSLIKEVSSPRFRNHRGNGTKEWSFILNPSEITRSMDEYSDAIQFYGADSSEELTEEVSPSSDNTGTVEYGPDESQSTIGADQEISGVQTVVDDLKTKPSRAVPIANAYGQWPIPEEKIPEYQWVLLVNKPESVREFSGRLGCKIPELLAALRKRGMNYSPNDPIGVPLMRALAFEFECFPANSQREYDEITASTEKDYRQPGVDSESPEIKHQTSPNVHGSASSAQNKNTTPSRRQRQKSIIVKESSLAQIMVSPPFTVPALAIQLGVKPFQIMRELLKFQEFPDYKRELERSTVVKVGKELGLGVVFNG